MSLNNARDAPELLTPFVKSMLKPDPEMRVQSFEYYAAHFIIGSGVICKDLDGLIRAWAHELKLQYDLGVEHGLRHPGDAVLRKQKDST